MATKKNLTLQGAETEKPTVAKRKLSAATLRKQTIEMLGIDPKDELLLTLTAEEIAFCHEMVMTGMNKVAAYRNAFKVRDGHGSSSASISKKVYRLMQREDIRKLLRLVIEKSMGPEADNLDARLLNVYMERAFYDVKDFLREDGNKRDMDDIPVEKRCVIDGIEVRYYGKDADVSVTTYKLADRNQALKALNEYLDTMRGAGHFSNVGLIDAAEKDEDLETFAEKFEDMDDDDLEEIARKIGG